jgi:hypothetical protein
VSWQNEPLSAPVRLGTEAEGVTVSGGEASGGGEGRTRGGDPEVTMGAVEEV